MIRASAPYTSGWGSFVLLKIDRVRVAWRGSLSTLHRPLIDHMLACFPGRGGLVWGEGGSGPGGSGPGEVPPCRGEGFSLVRGGVPPCRGVSLHGDPPTPPVNRITDTCKNITLATTSLRPVKINILRCV